MAKKNRKEEKKCVNVKHETDLRGVIKKNAEMDNTVFLNRHD